MKIEDIAKICHEANRALCKVTGDNSQLPWRLAEQWQRDSAIEGVRWRILNPDAPDSSQHDSWMESKERDGWVYDKVKDPEKKTHPCMVPYEHLPKHERAKDALFGAIVDSLRHLVED